MIANRRHPNAANSSSALGVRTLSRVLLVGSLVALAGCGLFGPEEDHFYHEIRLELNVTGPDGTGVPSSVRIDYSSPRSITNTPEGPEPKIIEVAAGVTDSEGRIQFHLSHEVPEPPCCHKIHVLPLEGEIPGDSLDFSFQEDVYGGILSDLEGRDLPSVVERQIVLGGSSSR